MEKTLKLYKYVDGVNDTPFPSTIRQAIASEFTYDVQRMGSAPTITFSLLYPQCLDNEWSNDVYALFNGERFYVNSTPTSSYDNTKSLYTHEVTLKSERAILDTVYFFDVVSSDTTNDKPVSNSSEVTFFGDIQEFAQRLNYSLEYSGLDYRVYVDDGVTSEAKMVSFNDQFFTDVLKEVYNIYELPYYFVGKEIHIGKDAGTIDTVFEYGATKSLISVSKVNANSKIVNRCTGIGSKDNIPYYYPNPTPYGDIDILYNDTKSDKVNIYDWGAFSRCGIDSTLVYKDEKGGGAIYKVVTLEDFQTRSVDSAIDMRGRNIKVWTGMATFNTKDGLSEIIVARFGTSTGEFCNLTIFDPEGNIIWGQAAFVQIDPSPKLNGKYIAIATFHVDGDTPTEAVAMRVKQNGYVVINIQEPTTETKGWMLNEKTLTTLSALGMKYSDTPAAGDKISFKKTAERIPAVGNLMPSIYRETRGAERFYNAKNNTYLILDGDGEYYTFENLYNGNNPREHKVEFSDIKPTIKGMVNAAGQPIDEFIEFAYDEEDSDEINADNEYVHPYFYGKLRKFDGANGFNLFDHAIEGNAMTISMTDGNCGACGFTIGVDDDTQLNVVQVYEEDTTDPDGTFHAKGSLRRDNDGNVIREGVAQDMQNDTRTNEVWVALRKEESTFGVIMPNATNNYKPNDGDKFVIININLPQAYILAAEDRLKEAIIKYMSENNSEKFNFSIKFSRIYLEKNPDVLAALNENMAIKVLYNGSTYTLQISSYSYKMSENAPLPEITVELSDTITIVKNAIQSAVSEVRGDVINTVQQQVSEQMQGGVNGSLSASMNNGLQLRNFVSKFGNDAIGGLKTFSEKVAFADRVYSTDFEQNNILGKGWGIYKSQQGESILEIDGIVARKKLEINELVINQSEFSKGVQVVSRGGCKITRVEEYEDYYRCYFDNSAETSLSGFMAGDQARCQRFDEEFGGIVKYYWRLVVNVSMSFVDLSKTDCDGDGIPTDGDTIVQLGNREDKERQNAIIIASYPNASITQYVGINSYELPAPSTIISPDNNKFTGVVNIAAGSTGLANLEEWAAAQEQIDAMGYITKALKGSTTISGGLILTSLISLLDQDGTTKSGINGIYDPEKLGGGIAAWYGGDMADKFDYYYWDETDWTLKPKPDVEIPESIAQGVDRMDGTGYRAGGNFWWDADGNIHANPLSFFVGEETVGNVLALFRFNYKPDSIDKPFEDVLSVTPMRKFTELQIGEAIIEWDEENKALVFRTADRSGYVGFYGEYTSAKGANPDAGQGGGGTGGATALSQLTDVLLSQPANGDLLSYNGSKWINISQSSITPDLSGYATTAALSAHTGNATIHVTSMEKTLWNTVSGKVDAVDGYGLSQNDFTDTLLAKLNGIEEGANNYVHPTGGANTTITAATGKVLSAITVNNLGHVTSVSQKTLVAADIPTLSIAKISGLQDALDGKLDETTFSDMFEKVETETGYAIHAKYGFYAEAFMSVKGQNPDAGGGGTGGASSLAELSDVSLSGLASGQLLSYNGSKWTNVAQSTIVPTLKNLRFGSKAYNGTTAQTITAADLGALTAHQTLYSLAFQAGAFSEKTYTPNVGTQTVNIPTKTSHLSNDSGFITAAALTGYATQSWVQGLGYITATTAEATFATKLGVSGNQIGTYVGGKLGNLITVPYATNADLWAGELLSSFVMRKHYTINLTSLPNTNFYPVVFTANFLELDCDIRSQDGVGTAAYNMNHIHFLLKANGWTDMIKRFVVLSQANYQDGETTIGAVGYGDKQGAVCVWLRGGLQYYFVSNRAPSLKTTDYTYGSEIYAVGTSLSGGANQNVIIVWQNDETRSNSTVALQGGNVASATKLQTARTIWGQSFDGTAPVSGNMTGVGSISASGEIVTTSSSAFRMVYGSYGTFFLQDGSSLYLMLTNANDQYGSFNNLRPLQVTLGTGDVSLCSTIYVKHSEGNVGIGTSTPSYKLDVAGDIHSSEYIRADKAVLAPFLRGNTSNGAFVGDAVEGLGEGFTGLLLYSYGYTPIHMATSGYVRAIITAGGYFGIGTSSPAYKLDVAGAVHATTGFITETDVRLNNRIYFKGTDHYIEVDANGLFHFSHGVYTDGTLAARGFNNSGSTISLWGNTYDGKNSIDGVIRSIYAADPTEGTIIGKFLAKKSDPLGLILRTYTNGAVSLQSQRENDNLERFVLALNPLGGNVAINQTSASYTLDVAGTIKASVDIIATGTVTAKDFIKPSDARLKTYMEDIELTVSDIANAPAWRYKWKSDGSIDVGSTTQYWGRLIPELTHKLPDGIHNGMDYGKTATLAVICVARKVENHEHRIAELEKENEQLKQTLKKYIS